MQLCDTHCHLNLNNFRDDLDEVVQRARESGITRILVPGIDLPTSQIAVGLADRFDEVYAAVGVHPNDGLTWTDESLARLEELLSNPKVVAIGEIGLDYYRNRCPHKLQAQIFKVQLQLAASHNLPVVIHNRLATHDLWPILSTWHRQLASAGHSLASRPGVFHSYDGNLVDAAAICQQNFLIGINGPVTFKNATERQQTAAGLLGNHLLLETDAPFLTPHPHRGERNEPSFVQYINQKIAALRGISLEELATVTSANADRLFSWRPV